MSNLIFSLLEIKLNIVYVINPITIAESAILKAGHLRLELYLELKMEDVCL